MQLVWFEVHGFKRFASLTKLNVDGKLVAIVGPNEGGKTSLLQALQHCNSTNAVVSEGPSQETTRGMYFPPDHNIIEATYILDDDDRAAISHIPEAESIRWYSVTKQVKGTTFYESLKPTPKRDLTRRTKALSEIRRLQDVLERPNPISEDEIEPGLKLEALYSQLASDKQQLSDHDIGNITSFADSIEGHCTNHGIQECEHIPMLLRDLAEYESAEPPEAAAKKELHKRRPRFLKFTDSDRLLESEYNIYNFFKHPNGNDRPSPQIPKTMQNIAAACGLDIKTLYGARAAKDEGKVESLLDTANEQLRVLMDATWSQSNVTIRLRLNEYQLHVLVGATGEQFVKIAERSDGLRQFVALLMFLSREPALSVPPILLIDEAERHLHYDAQADLIQMLARQNVAAKVIYTTHSIGCLPEDLGCGVRLVEPVEGSHSKVTNWFWESDTPGFSRLLFGMGANTLAFIPVRFAVIAEGASDLLLLPTMLRLASNVSYLGFQVAPGLSSATAEQLAVVDRESPRTIFLTDSDEAGDEIKRKIVAAGISPDRVVQLPRIGDEGAVIEDFVAADAYVRAVNMELERSHGKEHQFSVLDVGKSNRPLTLAKWCISCGISEPSKRAIAYQLLESSHEAPIISDESRGYLQELLIEIHTRLGLAQK